MNKSRVFAGQPIFSQIINLFSGCQIKRLGQVYQADRYCKKFKTYDHLIVMLYAIFNRCGSLREVTTGLMASESRLHHLGLQHKVSRSTFSDANSRRDYRVFEDIHQWLYKRYRQVLPDSHPKKWSSRLYIIDSTTISLFQEVLMGVGRRAPNGKRKGGVKAHTLIKADEDVPLLVRLTPAASADTGFMQKFHVPDGSIITFDKGYNNYKKLEQWDKEGVSWVSRRRKAAILEHMENRELSKNQTDNGVLSDQWCIMGHNHHATTKLRVRLIRFYDKENKREFEFVTNNATFSASTIANIYKRRWQIETLFKRIKQNFPLKNFLGDSENAIKIQIWCALIADLLLKIIQKQIEKPWSFANLAGMIRLHLMTYIKLWDFLKHPEKTLKLYEHPMPSLFSS